MASFPASIGPYRIVEILGRGGMGVVYRGEHVSTGEPAAVKTVRVPHATMLQSIRREIHALARLRHPGIVSILAEGVQDGLPWYAMELIQGITLRNYCQGLVSRPPSLTPGHASRPMDSDATGDARAAGVTTSSSIASVSAALSGLPPLRTRRTQAAGGALLPVLTLIRRLCATLTFLHGEGIVHRDLKPDNILISGSREWAVGSPEAPTAAHPTAYSLLPTAFPVLVDFGLATRSGIETGREALEVAGLAVGTHAYMPPEQLRGELVDARADLYALGCILYELVAGQLPFSDVPSERLAESHPDAVPVPLSELVDGVPPRLDALIQRLLEPRPRDRIGHADSVATELAELGAEVGLESGAPKSQAYLYRPGFTGRVELLETFERHLLESGGAGRIVLIGGESGVGKTRLALEVGREARRSACSVLTGECLPTAVNIALGTYGGVPESPSSFAGAQSPIPGSLFLESAHAPRGRSDRSPSLASAGGPLQALLQPLQLVADRCREQGAKETERLLGPRGRLLAEYEPALHGLPGQEVHPEPTQLPAAEAQVRLFGALADTFAALCGGVADKQSRASRPPGGLRLVLILDDLQWADELTLGFLEFLLRTRRLDQMPLLVVGTYRSEEAGEGLHKLLAAPGVRQVSLARLPEDAVGSMVGDMLAVSPPPPAFVRYLSRHSEGNPFFVSEYLRTAVAEGLLCRDGRGDWQVVEPEDVPKPERRRTAGQHASSSQPEAGRATRAAASGASGPPTKTSTAGTRNEAIAAEAVYEALPLPRGIQELVARRLDSLSHAALSLVQVASVLGRETDERLVTDVARVDGDVELEAIEELLARQVLEEPIAGRLRFVHDKLREVAYDRVEESRRRELHQAAASALTGRYGAQPEPPYAELGHHWERAGCADNARQSFLAGARRARARYALAEAERLYRAYLALVDQPSSESLEARHELAQDVVHRQGRSEEALGEHFRELEEARELGDRSAEARSLRGKGVIEGLLGRLDEGRLSIESALEVARAIGNRQEEGLSLGAIALQYHLGQPERARALYEQALRVHRDVGNRQAEGRILSSLASLHAERGRSSEAHALYEDALAVHREVGDRVGEGTTLGNHANLEASDGQSQRARLHYEQALVIHREVGNRRLEGLSLINLASLVENEGRLHHGRQLNEQALAISREVGDPRVEALCLHNLGSICLHEGLESDALPLFHQAQSGFQACGDRALEGMAILGLGRVHEAQGRIAEARALYEHALTMEQQVGVPVYEGMCLQRLATLAHRDARTSEARLLYESALAIQREGKNTMELGSVLQSWAVLERQLGELERATELQRQAEAVVRTSGNVLAIAMLVCEQGHLELALGRTARGFVEQVSEQVEELRLAPRSRVSRALARLERAQAAFETGKDLLYGECADDLPEALQRRGAV